jgi:hypothetical protein
MIKVYFSTFSSVFQEAAQENACLEEGLLASSIGVQKNIIASA